MRFGRHTGHFGRTAGPVGTRHQRLLLARLRRQVARHCGRGHRLDLGATLFAPRRSAVIEGNAFGPDARYSGDGRKLFLIPDFGYTRALNGSTSVGLAVHATERLQPIKGVRLIGTARDKASVLSFVLDGHSTEQVGQALNREGIAVRSGHHCAQPILRRFGVEATVRPSLAFYNTCEEVDRFIAVVRQLANGRR